MEMHDSPLKTDKETFEKHLSSLAWQPNIWWDEDYLEIGFGWISEDGSRHAIVSIDGTDGRYGYAYLENGNFVSGKQFDPLCSEFPDDLRRYLNAS